MKRRFFLQSTGGLLAALGYNALVPQWTQYGKVLAQPTQRKLALLVGINSYIDAPLYGCVTDVELQRELLIHRFGFKPEDIITLTDLKATRTGILEAFEEHLIKQAQPDDVVVYHYSGHGSRITDPDQDYRDALNGTFIPVDSRAGRERGHKVVNDIMGHTLFLLMSSLKTERVTAVLDSCFSGAAKRGTSRIRALPRLLQQENIYPSQMELAYQDQLLSKLDWSRSDFIAKRRAGVAKGVVIASADRNQEAADASLDGFNAGAFTYYMTRYLWQQAGETPIVTAIHNISRRTTQKYDQDPELECQPMCQPDDQDQRSFYFLNAATPSADGVITAVLGSTVQCWLGALEADNPMAKGSLLAVLNPEEQTQALLRITGRRGLTATAVIDSGPASAVTVGALLREEVRGIPRDLALKIAVDPALGMAMGTATMALNRLKRVDAVTIDESADYILGRLTAEVIQRQIMGAADISEGAIGLFTSTQDRALRSSFQTDDGDIEAAIARMKPLLTGLLINRVLGALSNGNVAKLKLQVTVQPINGEPAAQVRSRGSRTSEFQAQTLDTGIVKIGDNLEITVQNQESQDLFISVLALGSDGELDVLFPTDFSAATDASLVGEKPNLDRAEGWTR